MQVLSWGRMPSKNGGDFAQMVEQQMADSTANVLSSSSPLTHEYKYGGSAGFPLRKEENPDGKKQLSNGMCRTHRIMAREEVEAGRPTRWTELEVHGRIRNISPALLTSMRHLTSLFLNGNLLTRIPPEIAQLNNLTMLDLSHNKLRSLPAELGDMISLCHLYLNSNQIRVLPYELGKLFRLQTLGLTGNPLSPEISKIYHDANGAQKLLQHLLDHLTINTAPPPERQWHSYRQMDDKPIATFTVLCYNVLCDKYATTNLYSYCPTWALNWEYRKHQLIKEICHYDADIVTLQEVETEQFHAMFLPKLEENGYSGIFSPKSRAKTMCQEDRKYVDGCAIFWKRDKFEIEREQLIEFTQVAIKKAQAHENMLNRVMPKDNIALAAVLKVKEAIYNSQGHRLNLNQSESVVGSPLIVCTAHIHWDPEFCDVKLIQSMMLAHELNKLLMDVSARKRISPQQTPVLICGDFNSLPDSGVFEFLCKGAIAKNHPDLKKFREDACLDRLSASTDDRQNYTHALRLDTAVDTNQMPWTNYTLEFKGVIDYIFATPQSLMRIGVLGQLDMNWVHQNKIIGFPHPHVPSDHIPIMAQYAIVPTTFQRQLPPIQHYGSSHSSGFGPVGR